MGQTSYTFLQALLPLLLEEKGVSTIIHTFAVTRSRMQECANRLLTESLPSSVHVQYAYITLFDPFKYYSRRYIQILP